MADVAAVNPSRRHGADRTAGDQISGSGVHGDEPGTDLDTVNGEPARQQGQQGFGDQEQYKLRRDWFPLYAHPIALSHQAAPRMRMGQVRAGDRAEPAAAAVQAQLRWHLDEMVVRINGKQMYLWRAVDDEGEVLEVLIQRRRNKAAAPKLIRKLLKKHGFAPTRVTTDKLRSYGAAFKEIGLSADHEQGAYQNNRAEVSHQPLRRRDARCSGSNRRDPPSASSRCMPPPTTPSTSSAI